MVHISVAARHHARSFDLFHREGGCGTYEANRLAVLEGLGKELLHLIELGQRLDVCLRHGMQHRVVQHRGRHL